MVKFLILNFQFTTRQLRRAQGENLKI